MREDYGHSAGSVFLSFILGGLVGAGVALLMAPRSGRETRDKLAGLAEDVKGKATGYAEQAKEKLSSTLEHGKDFVEEKKSLISSALEAGKDAYEKKKGRHSK
jgi:gas vesicle protein